MYVRGGGGGGVREGEREKRESNLSPKKKISGTGGLGFCGGGGVDRGGPGKTRGLCLLIFAIFVNFSFPSLTTIFFLGFCVTL